MIRALTDPRVLRKASYTHSAVYLVLLYVAFVDRHDDLVTVFGWIHGWLWILMSLLCLEAGHGANSGRQHLPLRQTTSG